MNTILKKRLTGGLIFILVLINIVQLYLLNYYKKNTLEADYNFSLELTEICAGLEAIEGKRYDDIVGIAMLASATGQAASLYKSTSYYKENKVLDSALWTLNSSISNSGNIEKVIAENDLTILIPAIKKVKENPLDPEATKELLYFVRKYTVIGSTLP
jgi:hypothetical protein